MNRTSTMFLVRWIAGLFSLAALTAVAAIAGLGLVVWIYDEDLPSTEGLASYQPATLTRVFAGEGELIGEYARERRIFTPIEEIPDLVKQAFISAEDKNFYQHPGVDAVGIARAAVANARTLAEGEGGIQGASTITQQVMKNFLLTSDRSIERKIKEAILSLRIEQALSKDRILELYLNEIFLGQNAYGVAAAAQRYYGKTLEDLTPAEAAYLAALPKAPSALHPVREKERAVERRNYVLREMRENGHLDRPAYEAAQTEPLHTLFDDDAPISEIADAGPPTHVTEDIRRRLGEILGEDALFEGGLTVRATIDPDMQEAAAEALRDALEARDRRYGGWRGPVATVDPAALASRDRLQQALSAIEAPRDIPGWTLAVATEVTGDGASFATAGGEQAFVPFSDVRDWARPRLDGDRLGSRPSAPSDVWAVGDVVHLARDGEGWTLKQTPEVQGGFLAMDATTGRILAMQGGFSWMTSTFNRATQALRQPGSAFKPFVYAAALEAGYSPGHIILDAPIVVDTPQGRWKPQNSSGSFYGPAPMSTGLQMSRNAMTVRLAQEIGMERIAEFAERLGVYDDMPTHLANVLGSGEVTMERLAAAYASFANGGVSVEPTLVDRVQDRHGDTIWRRETRSCADCEFAAFDGGPAPEPEGSSRRVMSAEVAGTMVSMLRGVVQGGTASRPFAGIDLPIAGKTGTTNDAKDVWFVGFTPEIVAACYIGYDDPRPLGDGAFGGTLCAPVVAEFFRKAYEDRDAGDFEAVAREVAATVEAPTPEGAARSPFEPPPELGFGGAAAPGFGGEAPAGNVAEATGPAVVRSPSAQPSRGFDRSRGLY